MAQICAAPASDGSCAASLAQPTLDSLWPNPDGMRWDYDYHFVQVFMEPVDFTSLAFLEFDGNVGIPGGTAQVFLGGHDGMPDRSVTEPDLPYPLLIVWRGRPDLREAIVARCGRGEHESYWFPYFLHPGYFLTVGATITLQLAPEFDDDIFLHGTVASIDATVTTPAGVFTDVVLMNYLVDFGWQDAMTDEGEVIGRFHSEHRGRVSYVPDVGPVDLYEEDLPFAIVECPDCPSYMHEYEGIVTQTQSLTLASTPTGTQTVSWSSLKAAYRNLER